MSNEKKVSSSKIKDKIRLSLVIKLNLQMMGRLFSGFLAINILVSIIVLSSILWKAEEGIHDMIKKIELAPSIHSQSTEYAAGYDQVIVSDELPKGVVLPRGIQKLLPVKNPEAKRSFSASGISKKMRLLEKAAMVKYHIILPAHGTSYRIIYDFGDDLRLFLSLSLVVLLFEFLILIGSVRDGSRSIRKTLKPLSEMAETARRLNDEVFEMRSIADGTPIKDLTGVISNIDAKRLDRRISLDSSQNELKDLASAINDMLNRINSSYQSQVRFVSDASHELRTPISVIQGYVNLLDRWGKKDEKILQESIDAIKNETESMKELVEQLLFLARSDNETMKLNKEDFDACDVVDEVINETQMIDPSHRYEIDLQKPAYINADRQLIKQLVRILVDNSIKYTPVGEIIIIKVTGKEDSICITVQDNGIGIAPEDLNGIFDRFFRSDESRARKTGGSGLGLSIAKWIVEHHGGYFEVWSRIDIGTRTTIVFPAGRPSA